MAPSPGAFASPGSRKGPRAMDVLDEAVSLLRRTPLSLWSLYYLGALPCCLAFIDFSFDMTQGADASRNLPREALLLTVLYFWMKTCQAVFARRLVALLEGEDAEPWTLRRWANTALLQVIFAGTFPIVYPMAILIAIPFGWIQAFYHNISIVATGARSTLRSSFAEALELSSLWPKQNHLILGILAAALLFLFVNLAIFCAMLPALLHAFFGIATVFDENGYAWNNSSFYLDVLVFCFLVLNPLNKAVYALRCFYGRSRLTGADLRAELRRLDAARPGKNVARALAVVICLAAVSLAPARADAPALPAAAPAPAVASPSAGEVKRDAGRLDGAIQQTLRKDEFAWRMPRQDDDAPEKEGILARTIQSLYKALVHGLNAVMKAIIDFLRWVFHTDNHSDHSTAAGVITLLASVPWRLVFIVTLVVVVGCLLYLLLRHFRARAALPVATPAAAPVRSVDLEADDVRADQLPEDSWLALARELIAKGEPRLALRALYLATLSVLARSELVRLGPAKSNRDYLLELTRRLRGRDEAVGPFRSSIALFEASWYGTHAVDSAVLDSMLANHHQVRTHATA